MADPLKDIFGDPLADVFGEAANPQWTANPLERKAPGPLESALEGKSTAETAAETANDQAILEAASNSKLERQKPTKESVPAYLGHGLESGLYAAGGMAGDVAEAYNPVTAARDMWLSIRDTAHQAMSGSLVGDRESYLQTEAAKAAATPFTRFAERMQQDSIDLAQTPDGQKYNKLLYATTDPSKSALLSPVRMIHDMLQSLPSTAAMATTVYLTRGAAAKAYGEALAAGYTKTEATAIATKAAGKVASLAGALGEGVVGGLQQGEQTRVQVQGQDVSKSPIYQAMIRAGVKPQDAKQYVASEAGSTAGWGAGTVDAVTNIAEGPILGKIISEGGPLAARIAKGFLAEGTQEGVQGFGEQISQNEANKLYVDPDQKLADGVAENVVSSFVVGGLTGGMFAGVGGNVEHPDETGVAADSGPTPTAAPTTTSGETKSEAMPTLSALDEMFGPELDAVSPAREQPGTDPLGRSPVQKPPAPGRAYNVADAIAELGMSPEEAHQFVTSGNDPRAKEALAAHGIQPDLTADDLSSPIPTEIIAAGKSLLGKALETHSPVKGANLPQDVVQGLIAEGIPEHIARGAAAGSVAESGNDHTVVNSTSGAFGLGQWLGSRKEELFRRYGPNPTREQQIKFLAWELKGGDFGGKSVLAAKDEQSALNAYIRDFMRPAAGKETTGDIQRGLAALGLGPNAPEGSVLGSQGSSEAVPGADRAALTVEETMAKALGPEAKDEEIQPGAKVAVTQNGETVPGTVQETYGEGKEKGAKIALDNGTTFDEVLSRAREYGAKLTLPQIVGDQVATNKGVPKVAVSEEVQPKLGDHLADTFGPQSYAGEKIDNEYTAFAPHTGSLGIPRAEMPQIKQEDRGAAVNFFEARGISHEEDNVPASSLKPTQAEFAPTKVQKFLDNDAGDRAVLVSNDGYVLDGHHQWIAALDKGTDVRVIRLGAPIKELITAAHAFPSSRRAEGGSQIQPDMFGGTPMTAEQLDARRFAPRVLREVTKANKLDDLWDATDYVLRRSQKESATPGDQRQSVKELSQATGRTLSPKEATAYALELERLRDNGETGKPKAKSAQVTPETDTNGKPASEEAAKRYKDHRSFYRLHDQFVGGAAVARGERTEPFHKIANEGEQEAFDAGKKWQQEQQAKSATGPRVFVNHVGLDGKTDAERGRPLTDEEKAKLREPIADQPTEAPANVAAAEAMREKAQPHQDELAAWGKRWAKQGDEYGFINPGLKSAERIVEKMEREDYESLDDIKDVARVGFKVPDRNRATDLAVSATRTFGADKVTDKGWRMVDGDYFDRKLIIQWEDGTKAEVQIIPDALEEARHEGGGAELYTEWRRADPGPEKDALLARMEALYSKAASGTSWESLFNELKSASGNALRAASGESETPGLVAKPGAEPQRPADQTTAQALPDSAPEATSRSSTSKNENALISDSNVGNAPQVGNVSEYGAKNTIVTRTQADIARAIIRDKLARQLNSGFDPEMLSAGAQLAAFHLEAGARKFADFAKAIADDLGTQAAQLKPYLAAWYNGARDLLEGHGVDVSDMDSPETVRAGITSLSTSVDDIGENGGTNGGASTDQAIEGADRADDARTGAGDALSAEGERGAGAGSDREGGAGEQQLSDGNGPSDEQRTAGEPEPIGSGSGERDHAGPNRSGERGDQPSRRVRDTARGADFRAARGALERKGSWLDAANRNLDIIELVNKLDAEGRPATPEEQALLSKWVGWGASDIRNKLFPGADRRTMTIAKPTYESEWSKTIERARDLLTGKDLETALQSVQYAHYTSEGVVRSMWDAFARMGFEGGRILEPGMGIGHFFTAAPDSIADHSTYTGVELDAFSAKVAKYLLPNENVIQGDYTKQAFPDGFFDAAIGNPPFANTKILDDPAYKKMRLSLHNYFFVKTLDKVRPGGLLAFITSRYTMDAIEPKQRQFMADRADLVGAIRLPQTAFKQNAGTDVVTDVLFFQRRMPGAEAGGEQWLKVKPVTVDGQKVNISEYFAAHPEMVLGRHKLHRGMYRDNDLTVEPYASKGSIEKQFAEATQSLPESIYTAQVQKNVDSLKAKTFERDFAPASSKEGGLYVKDGKLLVVDRGSGIPVEAVRENLKPVDRTWLKGYAKLRDLLKEAQRAQLDDAADWESKLSALKKEYAKFTKAHGRIKEFTTYERTTTDDAGEKSAVVYRRFKWDKLMFDVEAPLVWSLERITDHGEIEDGPFLKGRTLNKPTRPKIESVHDALAVTLDEIGKLDLGYLAKLAGLSEDAAIEQLGERVYQTPAGEWQTDDEYLSGNVLQKLEEAQAAAATAPQFQRNVEALLKVQPPPLSYDRISVKLGAPWIRPETVQQFADEVLGEGGVPITYEATTAHWSVEGAKARFRRSVTADFGTPERSALELLDAVLNNRSIKVTQKIEGKEVVLPDQTTAANEAAKKIAERFKAWLWEDSARTAEYVETYNRSFNNIAPRRFNGDHLTLPGLSANFKPHPHVKRAVWRIIQTGNTYLAHAVGAGKTAEQIIGAQEQKRLGLIKKPMHIVPNHMLKQFSQEFLELYPAANIMVADEQAFHTGNRRRFLAQAALNDPDAIIITHSAFGKIDTSDEMRARIVGEMVAELEDAFNDAKKSGAPRHLVSRLEKQIEQMKRRFEAKQTAKDKLLTFDELGVDFLLVDEAHEFRKLDFATNRQAKGIDATGSARALDLFIKSQWLEQRQPGRSMVMASGTPVTNTMAELYTVMRFMDLKSLEKDRIGAFDAWANMFGEVAAGYERNAAGGYEIVERFSKFVNVPELMKRVRNFMDVLSSAQLGDLVTRPKIIGGGPQNVLTPISDDLEDYMKGELDERLKESRAWKPSREQPANPDPVINIITDARLSSIDMRYIHPNQKSDPESKLNQMITRIAEKHREYGALTYTNKDGTRQPRKGAAQIVFSPVGFGAQVAKNRGFDVRGWIDSELIRQGVKKSEIGWMSDANTHAKKEQLQKDVRSGKVRILIGSPKNMGTGLNVQDRLKVLHFLAPPWYPSDVTQPHGRIERQGNQNGDIELFWYATRGTYDSTGWGMVARKQKFIDDAMSGDDSVRTLEDISEVNQFEMAAALAAGDDRVIRIAELGGEVERLTRLKGAHADQQRTLRSQITTLQDFELPRLERRQEELKAAQAAKGGYQPFSLTVGSQSFDKAGEAGDALKAAVEQAINASTAIEQTEVAKLYGEHPVYVNPTRNGDFQLELGIGPTMFNAGRPFAKSEDIHNVGIIHSLESAAQQITSSLQQTGKDIDSARSQLEASKRKYGAPFPEEGQLNDAIAERNQLQAEMAAETKAKEDAGKAPALPAQVRSGGFALAPDNAEAFQAEMRRQLRQFLPNDSIALRVVDALPIGEGLFASGQYHPWLRMVSLAEDTAQPEWTIAHEGLHAMRSLGLFTEPEWDRLVKFAWTDSPAEQAQIRERWGHLDLTEGQLQEEAVAEMFGQYWDVHQAAKTPLQKLFVRSAIRVLRFVAAIRRAIRTVLGKPDDGLGSTMDILEQMRKGHIGARPEGFGGTHSAYPVEAYADTPLQAGPAEVRESPSPASPDFGGETERRWQEAKKGIGAGAGVFENAKAWWEDLTGGFTRHWRALPNIPRFADVSQQLRKLEAAPHAAMTESVRYLKALVGNMSKEEYDLFSRKVVLDDLAWDAGEGRELPFGFTPSTLTTARANIDAQINLSPKLVRAIRERKNHNARITDAMVRAGVLTKEQVKNPAYFRHMVLDYARHEAALARTPSKVKSPYWAKRMGSSLDINANLLEAELDWLQKAQIDTDTADTIEWIKRSNHNIRDQLQTQARADNKARLDRIIASNPSAAKEDGWFRSNIARGYALVKAELESGTLDPIPPHLQGMADDIANDRRGEPPFALMAWMLDNDKPGSMGAGMVLKYTGLRKQWQRNMLGAAWLDTTDVASLVRHYKPEGTVAWQPKEGRHLFTAKTISESALDMFASKLADTATPGIDREELARALTSVRSQLVVGGDRYTMVLPEELAATLDEFGDRRGEGMVAHVFSGLQSAWKRWVLINPRRYLKYNLNNQTGDLDAVIAGNPATLKRVPEAWRMLREASKGRPSARYTEALDRGVFTSALSAQEIPDINRLSAFRHLAERSNRPDKLLVAGVGKLWRALQDSTNFRESLFRLAAYLDYVDKIEGGMPQLKVGYGASLPKIVDAVQDPKDRAALLARDLLGDYGSISVAGSWLRRYLVPFWSWMEINTRRYWRLTANAYTTSKGRGIATGGLLGASVAARTGIALYLRMALLYGVLELFNRLLWPDEEKELGEVQRSQLHLILGRDADGNIITLRTQGALSDVLSTLGFTDGVHAYHKWMDGQDSLGSIITAIAKAPVNRVVTSINPLFGEPTEQMLGQELWPDIFNPRVIHDRWRHLFQTVNLDNEYDLAASKPSRGYAHSWTESLVYKRNPDEMAYDQSRSIAYDWLAQKRGERGGASTSERGEALRDYRMALRYGDQPAADKALQRYADLGGTKKTLKQSIKQAHPLGPIAKKDRAEFLASLTDEQLDTFVRAEHYWQDTFTDQ